jgi:hypothetical protein
MRNNNLVKISKNFKTALLVLLVVLIAGQTFNAGAFAIARTVAPRQRAELESAAEAKRGLAGINARNFEKFKNPRERRALQRSYDALKAIANNTSKAREAALMAKFDKTIGELKALTPTAASYAQCDDSYRRCREICNKNGNTCDLCNMVNGLCYLTQWSIGESHLLVP